MGVGEAMGAAEGGSGEIVWAQWAVGLALGVPSAPHLRVYEAE